MVSATGFILFAIISISRVKSELSLGKDDLAGIFPSTITPYYPDGSINIDIIPRYAEFLAENGIPGVLVSGTGGEGPVITLQERITLLDAWLEAAKENNLQVIMHVSVLPFPDTLKLTRYCEQQGVDAILVLPELYYRPDTERELLYAVKLIADEAPNTPLFYYDTIETYVDLNMVEFFKLASSQIQSFCGLKTDLLTGLRVIASTQIKPNQRIIAFTDSEVISYIEVDINGTITILCNIFPKLCVDAWAAARSRQFSKALDLQQELNRRALTITRFNKEEVYAQNLALLRVAMEMVTGIEVGEVRKPLNVVGCNTRQTIAQELKKLGVKIVKELGCDVDEFDDLRQTVGN